MRKLTLILIIALFVVIGGCVQTSKSPTAGYLPRKDKGRTQEDKNRGLLYRPKGKGPFPTVIYNHGKIVDLVGLEEAARRGYDLEGICKALANDGFLVYAPIRESGRGNIMGHKEEVFQAVDYVKTLPDVDPSRIALMGFSRGGLLALMVGVERKDLEALVIMAPAPGEGNFSEAIKGVSSIDAPVLLLVEAGDDPQILEDYEILEQALREEGKEVKAVRYQRGGGHKLFSTVDYYWEDVRGFLQDKLEAATSQ